MHLLEERGYYVDGLDLSRQMLDIAITTVKEKLFQGNLLNYCLNQQYDAFAVFNHLQDYEEFEIAILHWYKYLNKDGIFIIDLHNGRKSDKKEDTIQNYKRTTKWTFDEKRFKENTDISYTIDNKVYHDSHEFLIYKIEKIQNILDKHHLKYELYENYSKNIAGDNSKNIQIVIKK